MVVSLNSRLESNKAKKKEVECEASTGKCVGADVVPDADLITPNYIAHCIC